MEFDLARPNSDWTTYHWYSVASGFQITDFVHWLEFVDTTRWVPRF
jgi:hypothetical protein